MIWWLLYPFTVFLSWLVKVTDWPEEKKARQRSYRPPNWDGSAEMLVKAAGLSREQLQDALVTAKDWDKRYDCGKNFPDIDEDGKEISGERDE